MTKAEIKLGLRVKDQVTGFAGIVIAKTEYLNGCVSLCIKPEKLNKEKESVEAEWVDYQQVDIVDEGLAKKKEVAKPTGGRCYSKGSKPSL